ncbi:MAG: DUF4932 domain-containing protein [Elusimicrobia bacterium]|nr:DUF4932 domain-containing protein [Elusimicrobiota bacterium]
MITAALLLLLLPSRAPAAPRAAKPAITTDPRVELLGVVQWLSGARPNLPADEAFAAAVNKSFAPFASHPAVALYRETAKRLGGQDGTAIDLLYYTDPPALARRTTPDPAPYLDEAEESARFDAFLAALRDFSKKSAFPAFYAAHQADYARVAAAAAAELGASDPLVNVQKYVGLPLDSRARWIVSPLFVPSHRNAYISPYPDPAMMPDPGAGPFEVTTLLAYVTGQGPAGDVVTQRNKAALWQEPLFVFLDPAVRAFDAARGGSTESYYGPEVAKCRQNGGADCVENWLIAALSQRLDTEAFGAPSNKSDGRDPQRDAYAAALADRLGEYEKDRKRWPTLWDFFPTWMAVFPEKAGLPAPPPVKLRPAASVKDLFPGAAKRAKP